MVYYLNELIYNFYYKNFNYPNFKENTAYSKQRNSRDIILEENKYTNVLNAN